MSKINSGWGKATGLDPNILSLIGWAEYIDTAVKPYPEELLEDAREEEPVKVNIGW